MFPNAMPVPAAASPVEQIGPSSIVECLADLDDPREGPIHPIEEIMLLTVCAVICGANTFSTSSGPWQSSSAT